MLYNFLDIAQAFDRVWHDGLPHKLKWILPKQYYQLFKSYLNECNFHIKYEDEYSELKEIRAGVPQGSVLGPALYLLYISDLLETLNFTIAIFADDTAVVATGNTLDESTTKLQRADDDIATWTRKWRIKLKEIKYSISISPTKRLISDQFLMELEYHLPIQQNTPE
jgi:hypothetical protein